MAVTMFSALTALSVAASGMTLQAFGPWLAAASSDGGQTIAPYVQGGGSAAAVGGLVYIARLIAKGELVPRAVKDTENELNASIMVSAQREARVMQIVEEHGKTTARLEEKHDAVIALLTEAKISLAEVASEMEYWREMRDRGTRREDRDPRHREGPR